MCKHVNLNNSPYENLVFDGPRASNLKKTPSHGHFVRDQVFDQDLDRFLAFSGDISSHFGRKNDAKTMPKPIPDSRHRFGEPREVPGARWVPPEGAEAPMPESRVP